MKNLLLFIAVIFSVSAYGQHQPDSNEIASRNSRGIAFAASHGKMAWFTNHTMEQSEQFQVWLQTDFHCQYDEAKSASKHDPDGRMTMIFTKEYSGIASAKPD